MLEPNAPLADITGSFTEQKVDSCTIPMSKGDTLEHVYSRLPELGNSAQKERSQ